jgi:RNA polymerase sigma-70 factor, ECF subfamily
MFFMQKRIKSEKFLFHGTKYMPKSTYGWFMNEQKQRLYTELLVIRCQQGEKEDFELLVELWQKPMVAFAFRYLDQEMDVQDAVQETWFAVIKGLDKIQSPSLFISWLYRILINKCIDKIRKKRSELQHLKQTSVKTSSDVPNENEYLSQAIQRLSDEQKAVITLRFGNGLQVCQIAAILNISEGTVKSRLHRALTRLREILGDTK